LGGVEREDKQKADELVAAYQTNEYDLKDVVAAALADQRAELHRQVREAVETMRIDPNFSGHWQNGFSHARSDALSAIDRVFGDGNKKLGEG